MLSSLTLRPEPADQPDVLALLAALDAYLASLYPPQANHILDPAALSAPEVTFLVARVDGRAVGTGAVRRRPAAPETDGRPFGEVKRMVVHPGWRGRGIGEQLLQALHARLRDDGIGLSLLETGRDQHAAVRLYRRCGYVERGPFGGYPDNGLSLFMERMP